MKNLVAVTPVGLIVFVSNAYGGRISDQELVSVCDFFNILIRGMVVMAGRGFKNIESYLVNIGCLFLRPPSVIAGEMLEKRKFLLLGRSLQIEFMLKELIKIFVSLNFGFRTLVLLSNWFRSLTKLSKLLADFI